MTKTNWIRVFKLMVIGALGFWLPDTILHGARGQKFDAIDVQIITVVMPITFLVTFALAKRVLMATEVKGIGLAMLGGIWLLGGAFMATGASFSHGGFLGPDGVRGGLEMVLLSVLPIYTFMLATYDGSLGALLVVTIIAVLVGIVQLSRKRLNSAHRAKAQNLPDAGS